LDAAIGAEPVRAEALRVFAANLEKAFYGFEPDFFQQNLLRIVDDVVSVIKGSIELWPTLASISTRNSSGNTIGVFGEEAPTQAN
jgi:hypothetical protein